MDVRRHPRRAISALAAAAALTAPLLLASAAPAAARADAATAGTLARTAPAAPTATDATASTNRRNAEKLARKLVDKSSAQSAYHHLERLQAIADSSGGNRAAGTTGHDASAAYVYQLMKDAGYHVSYDTFDMTYTETQAEKLSVVSPAPRDVAIKAMTYTKSTPEGGIRAAIGVVPVDGTTGCEPADYASGTYTGRIALIRRGGCTFAQKQATAADAGAAAAVIYNNTDGDLAGTLGDPDAGRIPTGGVTKSDGEAVAAQAAAGEVTVSLEIRQLQEKRTTRNVIAETAGGDANHTVMLGSHLDSVTAGPGINDNGSGSAGLLEVAQQLAKAHEKPQNKIRFAWWSAEELGLVGSQSYVDRLTEQQRKQIALYLNFDMIASPNFGQFVYDGDDSDGTGAGPGPAGSAGVERQITDFLDRRGASHEGTDFDGRSDYGPFIAVGIPSGGTFTGAEGVKTAEQATRYGGKAGVAYDACYHAACDTLSNINMAAFDTNIDVVANAVGTYAYDLSALTQPAATLSTRGDTTGSNGGPHAHHDRVTR